MYALLRCCRQCMVLYTYVSTRYSVDSTIESTARWCRSCSLSYMYVGLYVDRYTCLPRTTDRCTARWCRSCSGYSTIESAARWCRSCSGYSTIVDCLCLNPKAKNRGVLTYQWLCHIGRVSPGNSTIVSSETEHKRLRNTKERANKRGVLTYRWLCDRQWQRQSMADNGRDSQWQMTVIDCLCP